jgi:hypothetical protein
MPELSQVATVPVVVVLAQLLFDAIREREERGIPRTTSLDKQSVAAGLIF